MADAGRAACDACRARPSRTEQPQGSSRLCQLLQSNECRGSQPLRLPAQPWFWSVAHWDAMGPERWRRQDLVRNSGRTRRDLLGRPCGRVLGAARRAVASASLPTEIRRLPALSIPLGRRESGATREGGDERGGGRETDRKTDRQT